MPLSYFLIIDMSANANANNNKNNKNNKNAGNNKFLNAVDEFFLEAEKENIDPSNNSLARPSAAPRRPPFGFEDQAELDTAWMQFFFPFTANNRPSRKKEAARPLESDSEAETELLSSSSSEFGGLNEVQTLHSDPPFLPSQRQAHVSWEYSGPWGDTCSRRVQRKFSGAPLKRKYTFPDFGGVVDDEILDKRWYFTPPALKRFRTRDDTWPDWGWLHVPNLNEFDGFPDWYFDSESEKFDFSISDDSECGHLPSEFEPQDWAWRPVEGRSKTPPPPASLPRDDCCWSPAPTI